jgi:hypothetical protein
MDVDWAIRSLREGRKTEVRQEFFDDEEEGFPDEPPPGWEGVNVPGGVGLAVGALALMLLLGGKRSTGGGSGSNTLVWSGGSYRVTPSDRLWLLRAVQAESNKVDDRRRVAQTLINRFVFLKSRGSRAYPTLTKFVRAYAQPINPLWDDPSDAKCQRNPRFCTSSMIAKRRAARDRSTFDGSTTAAVSEALSRGMTAIGGTSVHYAAPGIGAAGKIRLTPDRRGYNTFYAIASSRSWPGYQVA